MLYYMSSIVFLELIIFILVSICNVLNLLSILSCLTTFFVGWKLIEKENKPYWYGFIPFYNMYEMCEIAFGIGKGILCLFLFFPITNWIMYPIYCNKLREKYDYEPLFGVGLLLLPFVFLPILAFDEKKDNENNEEKDSDHISKMANWYAEKENEEILNQTTEDIMNEEKKDSEKITENTVETDESKEETVEEIIDTCIESKIENNDEIKVDNIGEKIDIVEQIQEKMNEEKKENE